MASAPFGDGFIVAGGLSANNVYSDTAFRYDSETKKWIKLPDVLGQKRGYLTLFGVQTTAIADTCSS